MASAPLEESIYPHLPLNPQNFRFSEAVNAKQFFEDEVNKNLALYKKYKRVLGVLISIRYFFLIVTVLFDAVGIGSLSKVLQYDLAIYFEVVSFGAGIITILLSVIESKIMKKIEKHDEIHTLSASSLSTIMDNFSRALNDGQISEQEFRMISSERNRYLELRKSIRTKHFHESDSQDLKKQFHDKIDQPVDMN
jgi:uncharacterized protein (UPF0262 family)